MHPVLTAQIAQDAISDRLRSAERERLGRQASHVASDRQASTSADGSGWQRLVGNLASHRPSWLTNFPAVDTAGPEACAEGDCT
jgi:hypothetical protein